MLIAKISNKHLNLTL